MDDSQTRADSKTLAESNSAPLVSCLCVTENRPAFLPWLLWNYDRQSYPSRELVIVDSSPVPATFPDRDDVRVIAVDPGAGVGEKRNLALEAAQGEIISWFDDDDWQHPEKLTWLVAALTDDAVYAGASHGWFVGLVSRSCERYRSTRREVVFNSAGFVREAVQDLKFPTRVRRASDTRWLRQVARRHRGGGITIDRPLFFWLCHQQNLSNPAQRRRLSVRLSELEAEVGPKAWEGTEEALDALEGRLRDTDPTAPKQERRRPKSPERKKLMKPSVTVILTAYKRDYFDRQLPAIEAQTWKPSRILVWQNENHVDVGSKEGRYEIVKADHNFKFHGRFTLPLLLETDYVAIFDDDCIPGRQWLENCLRCCQEHECIVGATGRTVHPSTLKQVASGAGEPVVEDLQVDFVGHCWFFKREWIHHMWAMAAPSFASGEDIHLAAACKIQANIPCYVPRQLQSEPETFGDRQSHLGRDEHATYKTLPIHYKLRQQLIQKWRDQGWKLIGGGRPAAGRPAPSRPTTERRRRAAPKVKAAPQRLPAPVEAPSTSDEICVVVTTFNRPNGLLRLLQDIRETRGDWKVRVRVYDDCSSLSYAQIRDLVAGEDWSYVRAEKHHGKQGFWQWTSRIYSDLKAESARYFFFLQDDIRLCSDFFDQAIKTWSDIEDPTKVSMMLVRDSNRQVGDCWTRARPVKYSQTWRTGWVDCIFMAERRYLEALSYRVQSPGARWQRQPTLGSGVGAMNSRALFRQGLGMHCVRRSLVALAQGRSQMNPQVREQSPCHSIDFVDGEVRHRELIDSSKRQTLLYLGVHEKNHPWGAELAMSQGFEGSCRQHRVDFRARPEELARDLERLCSDSDLCFLQNGFGMPLRLLEKIQLPLCFFASEATEARLKAHKALITRRSPDLVLSHTEEIEQFCQERSIPVVRVAHAYHASQYRFLEQPVRYDVAWVGSSTGRRAQLIAKLRAAAPDLNILSKECFDPAEVNDIYNASRIVLHFMAEEGVQYLPTRLFEVMPTAAALVCEEMGATWMPEDVRETFESFKTGDVDHLVDVIRSLLRDDAWQALAKKGQEVAPAHTWEGRAREYWKLMTSWIEQPSQAPLKASA